jgi:hypothetical protein
MQTNLLERRKLNFEQKKNRLKQMEAHLKLIERKSRTRKLIELGGLVSKARLDDLGTNTLYGALLSLKEKVTNTKTIKEWTQQGGAAFAKENYTKTPVIVKFESRPNDAIRFKMRDLGLKWNAIRHEWNGYVDLKSLKEILKSEVAEIIEVKEILALRAEKDFVSI